jgi:putative transposase
MILNNTISAERGWPVLAKEIQPDHIHLFVRIPPDIAVADAVKALKGVTAGHISAEAIRPSVYRVF